jgi:alkylhydroperoxidase/carboxymuconolactone decarboxylase family protein YurZ
MPDPEQTPAQKMIGDFLPKMVSLSGHLARARDNGLTDEELKEVIVHLAFYAGWPRAMSAIGVAKNVLNS